MSSEKSKTVKVIVIAGAGASAPLGYSTLFDFEAAIAQYAPRTTAKEKRELAYLFQQIRRSLVARGEYTDFEAILWRFSNYLDLCNNLRLDQFLENQFLSTVSDRFRYSAFAQRIGQGQNIVDNIILNHYGNSLQNTRAAHGIFRILLNLLKMNGGFLDYFTTNYDIGLENVWAIVPQACDIPIVTGIKDPLQLTGEWNSALLDIEKQKRQGFYIHRLHGCVRWFRLLPKSSDSDSGYKVIANPELLNDIDYEPCVMYPGRKFNTSQPPFADSFIRFRQTLSKTGACVIIGTSFRDNNLMEYLLEANDRRDSPLPIVIVDISNVKPRFFQRVREVRNSIHFHYSRAEWKVKFIVGDYLDEAIHKELLSALGDIASFDVVNENII